jgi:hypothetical protein
MSGVEIKKAIASGDWYECEGRSYKDEIRFRVRALGFDRTTPQAINPSTEVVVEGVLSLLQVEVVNLCKQPTDPYHIRNLLILVDQDGFEFERLESNLDRDRTSGLHRFSSWSDASKLMPKVKVVGTIAYALPDEEAEYSLAVKEGEIRPA